VHTGLVVVGPLGDGRPHDRWALGDTPTLAAQLHGLAAPDTVVISGATQRLIHGYFLCHPLAAQPGHGLATPLQVYRVVEESGAQHRLDVVTSSGLTPFVGREHEVGLLVACWEQAQEGLGRVVVIQGEAGIGKSRLVRVLQEHLAAEPHTEMVWRGSPTDQQSALHPVLTHLQRLVRVRPEDTPADLLQRLEEVLESSGLALPKVVPLFATLLALPLPERYPPLLLTPQRQRQQILEALQAWLLAEATRHPVLFIVEDLHWMDPSTLEFLSLLIDQVPTARLLLVLTCRPEFHPPWGFRAHLTPITLGRLAPSQATIMVQRVAGKALPPVVQQHLVAHTDGVPLFIEEVTKLVLESGQLQTHADHYALTGTLPALAIPATLHDALMARLDRLASSKAVAQLGAVLGRTFAYAVLQAVAPWDEMALQHGLRQLVEAELVYQRGVPPQATYRFKHALIQETAYQSLLTHTRQQYHQQIAQVLEDRFPETAEIQPELLAHHYTEAGLTEQAVHYWHRAGQRASERSAHVETVSHLRTGLELLQTLPETPERTQREVDMLIVLGASLVATKGYAAPEVEQTYTRAWQLCQYLDNPHQLFPVLDGLWGYALVRAELQTAHALGEQLVTLAQQAQDTALLVAAHAALGATLYHLGAVASAYRHSAQGIALYDSQQHRTDAFLYGEDSGGTCRCYAARALWYLGYPDQGRTQIDKAVTLAQQSAYPYSLCFALNNAAIFHQCLREVRATQERAEAVISLATEQEFTYVMARSSIMQGWALAHQGQTKEGIKQIHQGLIDFQATGAELGRPSHLALLAEAYGTTGQPEAGLAVLGEALALVDTTGERWYEPELYRLKGELLLQQSSDHQAEAESCFHHALDIARNQQAKSLELRATTSLARLWQQQGKRREARELLAPIYGWFTEGFDTADLQEAKALLAELG